MRSVLSAKLFVRVKSLLELRRAFNIEAHGDKIGKNIVLIKDGRRMEKE